MGDGPGALPPDLPYDRIRVVFTDLDGTLYPGEAHEDEPKNKRLCLVKNMEKVELLEALGVPVIPATGNNVGFAQKKLLRPCDGTQLRDLSANPGIYCNGALVLGVGGKELDARSVGGFITGFLDKWLADPAPPHRECRCVAGLAKSKTLLLRFDGLAKEGEAAGQQFIDQMMIDPEDYEWVSPDRFRSESDSVLSFLLLTPVGTPTEELLLLQQWLHDSKLLSFDDPSGRLSNGEGEGVVCKHVHVPGLGPEVDISPAGVNKGSAIQRMLADTQANLGVEAGASGEEVAVFGDAGNDIELFGMKRDKTGTALEPLGLNYRPSIRVAMPWANDALLLQDANIVSTVDVVVQRIVSSKGTP